MTDILDSRALREFIVEASEIVESMATGFSLLDEGRRSGTVHPAHLNDVFRAAHSLKGLAGLFGIDDVARLAHHLESLLDALRLGKVELNDRLTELLYRCAELFVQVLSSLKGGGDGGIDVDGIIGELNDMVAGEEKPVVDLAARVQIPEASLSVLTEYEEHRLSDNLSRNVPIYRIVAPLPLDSFEADLANLNALISASGEVITTLPSSQDSGIGIDFDVIAATNLSFSEVEKAARDLSPNYDVERIDVAASGATPKTERATEKTTTQMPQRQVVEPESLRQFGDTVRVDIAKLDELMGIVGELVLARSGLVRVSTQLKNTLGIGGLALDHHRLVRTLERRISDLQSAIMQVRMTPLSQMFERLARVVRRVAGQLDKDVAIEIFGGETELDKLIVEELVDPLMHLVRNAVDHGFEPEPERIRLGKPPVGNLTLRSFPQGNHVVIVVEDDGRGLDEIAIRRTALERGVATAEQLDAMSQRQVWGLIFEPGFSTRTAASETSGRGVGLDVVKHNIGRLSGMIDIETGEGEGMKVSITLPTTLAIIQSLIVDVAGHVFALPLAAVLEVVWLEQSDLCFIDGREMVTVRDETLPLLRLEEQFQLRQKSGGLYGHDDSWLGYVAIVGLAQHRIAMLVDDVTAQQDIVIKPLGHFLADVKGFFGATQLGDNETVLVFDVGEIVTEFLSTGGRLPHSQGSKNET